MPIMYIVLTRMISKEEKVFFALCPELDVGSQGETVEEADNNLKDAVVLYLATIEELGTRDHIFKERNIKTYSHKPRPALRKISMPKGINLFLCR